MSSQTIPYSGMCLLAALAIAIVTIWQQPSAADDSPASTGSGGRPERVSEEVDIFVQRAAETARRDRIESRTKKKKKKQGSALDYFTYTPMAPSDVGDGAGMISQGGHMVGKTFGRLDPITPVEVMPYSLADEHFVFADVRGFVSNRSLGGGNVGLGYRYLKEDWNAWGGGSVWYDIDQTSSQMFQQVGLSFEGLIRQFEIRSNVYLPVTSAQQFSNTISNAQIVGHQLLFGRTVDQGNALRGVDGEIGFSLPILERHQIRGFVGGYHFEGGSTGNVDGFKVRAEGVLNYTAKAQVLYTSDKLYGNNLMVGVSLQFPFGNKHPSAGWKQHTPSPFRFVERNYNVIVSHERSDAGNQVAVDPTTGQAYNIQQVYVPPPVNPLLPGGGVNNGSPDGTGTNPFGTIAAAQTAGGNVILVQSGSIINEAVTLSNGQHLFGQGSTPQFLALAGGGRVQIPTTLYAGQTTNNIQTPIFQTNAGSAAVTLANNSEVANFVFSGTSGVGIAGSGVDSASLHDLKFLSTGGDSIHLTNSTGDLNISNVQINSSTGSGIVIDGGNANIKYFGTGTTISAQQDGLVLENLTGGTVGISALTAKGTGGAGLRLSNVATDVTVDSFNATQTVGPAVAISGTTGTVATINGVSTNVYNTYNFTGDTVINSPKGAGFTVNGTDAIINVKALTVNSTASAPAISLANATSAITLGAISLNTTNATGLLGVGLSTLQINGGSITTVNAPAIDIQNSTINSTLGFVSVNGGPFGIRLLQSSGIFTIVGNGSYATGGTIQNTTTGVQINTFGTANLNWIDFLSNGTAISSNKSSALNMSGLRIGGSTGYALDSMDDSNINLNNSTLASNGALGGGTIRIQADTLGTFGSLIQNNTISDANGVAIQYATAPAGAGASLATAVRSNTISGTRGSSPVIGVNWNGPASVGFYNNTITAAGTNSTGILIQDTSLTDSLTAVVNGNAIGFLSTANQGTGLSIIAANTSQVSVTQNTIDFKATGGIGTRFSLSGASTDYIASNIITDEAGGATGMLFDTVGANSRLGIEANTINMLSTDLTTHQGIIFTSVTPTIQFTGSKNNLIYNTSSQNLFSIPVNAATGGFYINGVLE